RNFAAMASRNSGMPLLGVYLVKPAASALMQASLMCCGVSKSGSPAPKPTTSSPAAFIALALASMASVSDGDKEAARLEIMDADKHQNSLANLKFAFRLKGVILPPLPKL